jgi:predicted lipid-binding transport protein (Tim44 family)
MAGKSVGKILGILAAALVGGVIGLVALAALIFLIPSGEQKAASNVKPETNKAANTSTVNSEPDQPEPRPTASPQNSPSVVLSNTTLPMPQNTDSKADVVNNTNSGQARVTPVPQPARTPVAQPNEPPRRTSTPLPAKQPQPRATTPQTPTRATPVAIPTVHP